MLRLLQPPRTAQINNTNSLSHRFRHQRARNIVRCREEQELYSVLLQRRPRKRLKWIGAVTGKRWENVGKIDVTIFILRGPTLARTLGRVGILTFGAPQQDRLIHPRMAQKNPRQLQTGIAGRAQHSDFEFRGHQASIS